MSPIIRINSGAMRLSGGAMRLTAPPAPPQSPNIIHHYDFSDITTMWQDTGGTSAIVNGADIARIDDLGSRGDNPIQATISKRPIYQAANFGSRGGATFVSANSEVLNIVDAVGLESSDLTICVVWAPQSNLNRNAAFSWDGFPQHSIEKSTDDSLQAAMSSTGLPSVGDIIDDATTGVILTDTGSSSQEARFSIESAAVTGVGVSNGPDAGGTVSCGSVAGTLFFHDGGLAEVIIWTPALTTQEKNELELFIGAKWGFTWA